jgi:Protein of unknown function (DUF3592)
MKFAIKFFWVGVAMLATSLWLALPNWQGIKGSYFSDLASFSSAEGKIVSSSTYTSTTWKRKTYYHYSIEYEYIVNGKNYRSDEITFNHNSSIDQEFAQTYVSKYPVGKKVTVHYDPHDPAFSVLELEKNGDAALDLFFLAISALVFVLSGAYLLIIKVFFHKKSSSLEAT